MPEEYSDVEGAAEAFRRMQEGSGEPETPAEEPAAEQVAAESKPAPESTAPEAPSEPEEVEEFVPRADLESLLEGVTDPQAREAITTAYKSFQRGFTQRSQEVSELRRTFEGIDPQQAREAYEFVQNLTTNREYAVQVHKELSDALEAAGLSPAQATQEASRQVENAMSGDLEDFGLAPDNPLVRELNDLKSWRAEQERLNQERQFEENRQAVIRDIERQDQAIRRDNPSYDDDDMETVYRLAASLEGNLFAAQEVYEGLKDRLVTDYVASKGRAPQGVQSAPQGAAHSEPIPVVENLDQAHELAKERLHQIMNAS